MPIFFSHSGNTDTTKFCTCAQDSYTSSCRKFRVNSTRFTEFRDNSQKNIKKSHGSSTRLPYSVQESRNDLPEQIITTDESWIHFYKPERKSGSMVWKKKEKEAPTKFKNKCLSVKWSFASRDSLEISNKNSHSDVENSYWRRSKGTNRCSRTKNLKIKNSAVWVRTRTVNVNTFSTTVKDEISEGR